MKKKTIIEFICERYDFKLLLMSSYKFLTDNSVDFVYYSTKYGNSTVLDVIINYESVKKAEKKYQHIFYAQLGYQNSPLIQRMYKNILGNHFEYQPPKGIFPKIIEVDDYPIIIKEDNKAKILKIDGDYDFKLDDLHEFLDLLPRGCKFKENRIDHNNHKYYGIITYNDKILLTITSDDYKEFKIQLKSVNDYIGVQNEALCFMNQESASFSSKLSRRFFGKPFVHAFIKGYVSKKQFIKFHKEIHSKSSNDIKPILSKLSGIKELKFTDDQKFTLKYDGKRVEWVLWIPPSTRQIIESIQNIVIQLDATFSFDEYVVITPHLVFNNSGYPLGVLISPSENSESYGHIFEVLKSINSDKFQSAHWMGDFGSGLVSFFKEKELKVWHCLRHFLGRICPESSLYSASTDILWAEDETEYNLLYRKYEKNARKLHDEKAITDAQYSAFKEMNTCKDKIALFKRSPRISTTNHLESFHGKLTNLYSSSDIRDVNRKFEVLIIFMMQRINQIIDPGNRCAYDYLCNLQHYAEQHEIEQCSECMKCSKFVEQMTELYGTPMPCIHTCLHLKRQDIAPPPGLHLIERLQLEEELSDELHISEISLISEKKSKDDHEKVDINTIDFELEKFKHDFKYEIPRFFGKVFNVQYLTTSIAIMRVLKLPDGIDSDPTGRNQLMNKYFIDWYQHYAELQKKVKALKKEMQNA